MSMPAYLNTHKRYNGITEMLRKLCKATFSLKYRPNICITKRTMVHVCAVHAYMHTHGGMQENVGFFFSLGQGDQTLT